MVKKRGEGQEALDRIAGRHPGLKLVIDHVGLNVRAKGAKAFDSFGPRRTFWGTDLTRMPCTY